MNFPHNEIGRAEGSASSKKVMLELCLSFEHLILSYLQMLQGIRSLHTQHIQ